MHIALRASHYSLLLLNLCRASRFHLSSPCTHCSSRSPPALFQQLPPASVPALCPSDAREIFPNTQTCSGHSPAGFFIVLRYKAKFLVCWVSRAPGPYPRARPLLVTRAHRPPACSITLLCPPSASPSPAFVPVPHSDSSPLGKLPLPSFAAASSSRQTR